jgi:hypothetical protein
LKSVTLWRTQNTVVSDIIFSYRTHEDEETE